MLFLTRAAEETAKALFSGNQRPEVGMKSALKVFARFMGSYSNPPLVDERWWPNDGVVNTCSMPGPTLESSDRIIPYSGTPRRGIWNYMGLLQSVDHADILGMPVPTTDPLSGSRHLLDWYLRWAAFLESLPR